MFDNTAKYRVLKVFFDDPMTQDFQLREISRKAKLAPLSVKRYLLELEKEGLVAQKKHRAQGYPIYAANYYDNRFKIAKKIDMLQRIYHSGLIDYLYRLTTPDAIILFGSASKGEDTAESDIDLCVISEKATPNTKKFEEYCGRKISIDYIEDFGKIGTELKKNLANGIVLRGYLDPYEPQIRDTGQTKGTVNGKTGRRGDTLLHDG